MKSSRHHAAEVIGEKTLHITDAYTLAREIAAYLLSENLTYELESLLRDVMEYRMKKGVIEAEVVSAHELTAEVEQDVRDILQQEYPYATNIRLDSKIDTDAIGGISIELPNEQLDLSVRARLTTFKKLTS